MTYGCLQDGKVVRVILPSGKPGLGFFPDKKSGRFQFFAERCPLDDMSLSDYQAIEAGILHSADNRSYDLDNSSAIDTLKVLLVSTTQSKSPGGLGGLL